MLGHLPDGGLGEGATHCSRTDENCRLDPFDDLEQVGVPGESIKVHLPFLECNLLFLRVRVDARSTFVNETFRVEEDHLFSNLLLRDVASLKSDSTQIRYAYSSSTSTEEHNSLICQRRVQILHGSQDSSKGHCRGSLNVVVEGRQSMSVLVQDVKSRARVEVFPLHDTFRIDFLYPGHKGLDELIVLFSTKPLLAITSIVRVIQQLLVVGPDIETDWQCMGRMDTTAGNVERKLADRNAHSCNRSADTIPGCPKALTTGTLITETEDPLVVGHDDEAHICVRRMSEHLGNSIDVVRRDPQPPRPAEDV